METSKQIKERVVGAQRIQQQRFADTGGKIRFNAHMPASIIDKHCHLAINERNMLKQAFNAMGLSARAYHKILKIARTIADLAGQANIGSLHLAEAISYRSLDRKYW